MVALINTITGGESDALERDLGANIAGIDGEADGGEAGRVDEKCLEEHIVAGDDKVFGGGRLIGGGDGGGGRLVHNINDFGYGNGRWAAAGPLVVSDDLNLIVLPNNFDTYGKIISDDDDPALLYIFAPNTSL